MEHSALHALQLTGMVIVLGGHFLVICFLFPAVRALGGKPGCAGLAAEMERSVERWVMRGALAGAGATLLGFFVQVAEVQGRTVFGGANPADVWRFVTSTTVGQLSSARMVSLALVALGVYLAGRWKWSFTWVPALAAAVLTSLVSHAAAQPAAQWISLPTQMAHVIAVSVWIGALMHLFLARRAILSAGAEGAALVAEIVRRFSPVALAAAILLGTSGVFAAYRYLATPEALATTAYGLTLLVKLVLIVPVLVAGYVNFRVVRPALLALAGSPRESGNFAREVLGKFGRMLELEVTAGLLVIVIAGVVGSVSPPREDATVRLTQQQVRALLSPDLPTTAISDPSVFYNEPTRTVDDLRYAEFTHNWSGVMVTLLGCFWLGQSLGGRAGAWCARLWPFLMIPFAVFVAVAADPELWILRRITFSQALKDAQILEHQIGALLVLLMIWFGWRDRRRPPTERPVGYILPVIMILGSVLLLGHAHSASQATQELTNLINVQHAVLGALGCFAGTVRWFQLRGLFPQTSARVLWPGCVIAVGVFMAFFYREIM